MWLRRPQDHSGCVHDDYRRVRKESVIVVVCHRRYGSTTTAVPVTRSRTVRPCRTHNAGRTRQSTSGSNGQRHELGEMDGLSARKLATRLLASLWIAGVLASDFLQCFIVLAKAFVPAPQRTTGQSSGHRSPSPIARLNDQRASNGDRAAGAHLDPSQSQQPKPGAAPVSTQHAEPHTRHPENGLLAHREAPRTSSLDCVRVNSLVGALGACTEERPGDPAAH